MLAHVRAGTAGLRDRQIVQAADSGQLDREVQPRESAVHGKSSFIVGTGGRFLVSEPAEVAHPLVADADGGVPAVSRGNPVDAFVLGDYAGA